MRAAHAEPGHGTPKTAAALAAELVDMAQWLGLERVAAEDKGDLAHHLIGEPGIDRS